MNCPRCGYVMTGFDIECPRCQRLGEQAAVQYQKTQQQRRQELDTYVSGARAVGLSEQAIREQLLDAGWAEQFVDEYISSLPMTPLQQQHHDLRQALEALRESLVGKRLQYRLEWKLLVEEAILESRTEVSVIALLAADNTVLDLDYRIGQATAVYHALEEVLELAQAKGAAKVVAAHNHPFGDAVPSDPDVEWAALLHVLLSRHGIKLVDDIVVCESWGHREFRSVLGTQQFRAMVRRY